MRGLIGLAALALTGCSNPCKPGESPEVEIGTGELAFEPLGERTELVHGPQGGYHLLISLQMRFLNGADLLGGDLWGFVGGEPLARTQPWMQATCDRGGAGLEATGIFLIYDGLPEDLHGQTTLIEVEVRDVLGNAASAEATTVIWDPGLE